MNKQTLKTKLKQQAKQIAWRAITTVILTLTAVVTVWVYAAFVEPAVGPNNSTQDFAQNILGANNGNNGFDSSSVVVNKDGSIIERQEYQQAQIGTSADATTTPSAAGSVFAALKGLNYSKYQEYTSGSGNWTVPAGVSFVDFVIVGAGGGSITTTSGSGGGGEIVFRNNYPVTGRSTIAYVVGAGVMGSTGGQSSFDGIIAEGGYPSTSNKGGAGGGSGISLSVSEDSTTTNKKTSSFYYYYNSLTRYFDGIGGRGGHNGASVGTGMMGGVLATPFGGRVGGGGGSSSVGSGAMPGGESVFAEGGATGGGKCGGGASWGPGAPGQSSGTANTGGGAGEDAGVSRTGGSGYVLIMWR